MKQEDKELLLKDLCGRLPYGVICHTEEGDGYLCSINQTIFGTEYGLNINPLKRDYFNDSETDEQAIKPYLRPMSSITEEERLELSRLTNDKFKFYLYTWKPEIICYEKYNYLEGLKVLDWLNAHHFDYRGLIEKGLALEAPADMYKTE